MAPGEGRPTRQGSLWHESFYECITDRAPPGFEVRSEIPLSLRPRRADLLLLRRKDAPRRDDEARILRGLWPRLPRFTLVEFKSPTRGARRSELLRLLGYGLQYHERAWRRLAHRSELTLVLVVTGPSQALADDLASVDCHLRPLGNGYAEMVGFLYTTYVVYTDEVSEAEQDDFLRIFSHHAVQTPEAYQWLEHWIVEKQAMPNAKQREDFAELAEKLVRSLPPEEILKHLRPEELVRSRPPEEILRHYKPEERLAGLAPEELVRSRPPEEILRHYKPEERLAGLAPEERLAGLAPEERLAGLPREQQIRALPYEVLRGLSEEYILSLPRDLQQAIRRRLDQGE